MHVYMNVSMSVHACVRTLLFYDRMPVYGDGRCMVHAGVSLVLLLRMPFCSLVTGWALTTDGDN